MTLLLLDRVLSEPVRHLARAADSRTFWMAGKSRPMRMAMMAITTSSSMSVKPRRFREEEIMIHPFLAIRDGVPTEVRKKTVMRTRVSRTIPY